MPELETIGKSLAEEFTVFYAWQSDCPPRDNRNFIESAIETALNAIQKKGTVQASPRLDKDTKGVTGIPDIANTILEKIRASDAFVADVSFVGKTGAGGKDDKSVTNPNVMVELGYALSELGSERIIIVLNTATGTVDDLPFDLKNRRWPFVYEIKSDTGDDARTETKKNLSKQLQEAIEAIAKLPPRQKRGTIMQRLEVLETFMSTMSGSMAQNALLANFISGLQKTSPATEVENITPKAKCQKNLNDLITRVTNRKFHNVVLQQGMFVTTIIPTAVTESFSIFDSKNEQTLTLGLQPLGASGWSHQIYGDHFATFAGNRGEKVDAATEMTIEGYINATGHDVISISAQFWAFAGQKEPADVLNIPSVAFEKKIIEGIFKYLQCLKTLKTEGPWHIGMGIINVKKSILHVSPRFMFGGRVFEGEEILPPIIEVPKDIELTNQQIVARALRPVFDYVWREHGYLRSLNYSDSGDWVGQ